MKRVKQRKKRKRFSMLQAFLFSLIAVLVLGYASLYIYMGVGKQRISAGELLETVDVITEVLDQKEFYLMPDTAYLIKMNPAFWRSERTLPNYPDQELVRSTTDIKFNIAKGVSYNALIQSAYLMLDDQSAPYIIENGSSVPKKDLYDTEWMQTCLNMRGDRMLEWRDLVLSYTRSTKVITVYTRIESASWKDDTRIMGYLVVNYHYDALVNLIRAKLRYGETAVIYNMNTGAYLSIFSVEDSENTGAITTLLAMLETQDDEMKNPIYLQQYGQMAYCKDFNGTNIKIALLKENLQMTRFMNNIRYIFTLVIAGLLALICLLYFYNARQYQNYIKGIVRIIHAMDEGEESETIEVLPKFTLPVSDAENLHMIANKLLSDTLDIHELRGMLQSEKMLRSEVELLYSHAQINSHFLLNTLDSIYWSSVQSHGIDAAESRMIESLCYILKYALDASSMTATLREELDHAEQYLEIQQIRRKMPIRIQWSVPEALKELYVSKLIVQPILENSIQHGIRQKDENGIEIHISAFLEQSYLHIRIEDNGRGLPPEVIAEMSEQFSENKPVKTRHIGMANVNRRLQVMYGDACGIRLSASPLGGLRSELIMKPGPPSA